MVVSRILREGFLAGLIGATAVAAWFLAVDTISGQPFITPATLGSAVFWGVHDPALVNVTVPTVVGYTMIHVLAFIAIGSIAAAVACGIEVIPSLLFVAIVLFAAFEFGFYIVVALIAQPLLGSLAWWAVSAGNLIAAGGMGYYLWQAHPKIARALAEHPLGETLDDPIHVPASP